MCVGTLGGGAHGGMCVGTLGGQGGMCGVGSCRCLSVTGNPTPTANLEGGGEAGQPGHCK